MQQQASVGQTKVACARHTKCSSHLDILLHSVQQRRMEESVSFMAMATPNQRDAKMFEESMESHGGSKSLYD